MHYIIQGFVLFINAFPREPYKSSRKFRERLNSIFTPVKCEANFTNYPVVSDHVRKSAKFGLLDILKCGILGEKTENSNENDKFYSRLEKFKLGNIFIHCMFNNWEKPFHMDETPFPAQV